MPPKAPRGLGPSKNAGTQSTLVLGSLQLNAPSSRGTPSVASSSSRDQQRPTSDGEQFASPSTRNLEECIERAVTRAVNAKRDGTDSEGQKIDHCVRLDLRLFKVGGAFMGIVANLKVMPRVELPLAQLASSKRRRFSVAQKAAILESAESTSSSEAAKAVRKRRGFETVSKQMVERWAVPKVSMKRGRPANEDFRLAVLDRLIFTSVEKADSAQALVVQANVVYSYAVVQQAARSEQASPRWASDPVISKLQFSPPWVVTFLKNSDLHRRRVTNIEKQLPPVEEVDARMKVIQNIIQVKGYTKAQILNSDETGLFYGEKPKNQYVPPDAARASTPETDDKARFTAMLFGSAAGKMGKSYNIIKCSSKNPTDLTSTRVLQNLAANGAGFQPSDGWSLLVWQRSLTFKNKKNAMETNLYKRPLLRHTDGSVITLQAKAWMDSVGIAMWCDVLLGPHVRAHCGGRAAMIWDNCGSHNSEAVSAIFAAWGIELLPLPPKMTDQLQIMDLVVNAPLKAAIRRTRVQSLFGYFQAWKIERLQDELRPVAERKYPNFNPPKPTLRTGLQSLLTTLSTTLATTKFEESMARAFVEACQAPKSDGTFQAYTNHRRGSVCKKLVCPVLAEMGAARPSSASPDFRPLVAAFGDAQTRAEAEASPDPASDSDREEDDW